MVYAGATEGIVPSALFNWMSHGGSDLQRILAMLSETRTPVETVRYLIDTYGSPG